MITSHVPRPQHDESVRYRIDGRDRLIDVSGAWLEFASRNDARDLGVDRVAGRVLWEFVSDPTTVHLYQAMCGRIRTGRSVSRFRFRCDAPHLRRLLEMEITGAADGSIDFCVTTIAEESRAPVFVTGAEPAHAAHRLISMCSWCKRVRRPDGDWVEIEDGLEALNLFQPGTRAPAVSHGICEPCEQTLADPPDEVVTLGGFVTDAGRLHDRNVTVPAPGYRSSHDAATGPARP